MINKDALQYIGQQAVAAEPRYFRPATEPTHIYMLRNKDGDYDRVEADPAPRAYGAATVSDFTDLVQAGIKRNDVALKIPAMVMIGSKAIVGLMDESDRRERAHFPLNASKAFTTLEECDREREGKDQGEFVSMLRVDLHGCVEKVVVATFRSVRFTNNAESTSDINNSNKGVSRKLQMELVAGGNPIPDEIDVAVNVYEEFPGCVTVVDCAIQTNIDEQTFMLIPLAGELLKARTAAMNYIREEVSELLRPHLESRAVTVHCGEVNC